MNDLPAIAPGPPPPDPMGKIDPTLPADTTGCFPGCCGLAAGLWGLPAALLATDWFERFLGAGSGGITFLLAEAIAVIAGTWAAVRWATTPTARRRLAKAGGVATIGALLGLLACVFAAAGGPEVSRQLLRALGLACIPVALSGVAVRFANYAFPLPAPADAGSQDGALPD